MPIRQLRDYLQVDANRSLLLMRSTRTSLPMPFDGCHAGLSPGDRPFWGLAMPARSYARELSSAPTQAYPPRDKR